MIKKIESKNMGSSNLGWLKSLFHFSFADYFNPSNINFGVLRVLNDDLIAPGTGFDTHPHKDMEIISYIIQGELTHGDSMGNNRTLVRGQVQYMSAGTGVFHSEHNLGKDILRILQIWIYPDKKDYNPNYGEYRFQWEQRVNQWMPIVSGISGDAPIKVNQDANIYVLELEKGKEMSFNVSKNRQAYLVQIEGTSNINQIQLDARDSMEIMEEDILIKAEDTSHIMLIEMNKIYRN
jgi:redox-sensitive bicupin YhaK (pirin superfamily)